jgi:predicted methyltransferase
MKNNVDYVAIAVIEIEARIFNHKRTNKNKQQKNQLRLASKQSSTMQTHSFDVEVTSPPYTIQCKKNVCHGQHTPQFCNIARSSE